MNRSAVQSRRRAPVIALLVGTLGVAVVAAEPEVRVTLDIPPAETRVIGDAIPLFFRFENRSTGPVAFMWEGCCRFNGKLTVTRDGVAVPPTPPGQALAHMFAKAERLEPNQPKDFDTRLSDWVTLAASGTYELRGHYQGVLPFQKPQVPRGLELWRGTASTPPLRLAVINVADYLAQRAERSARRGLKLELAGPSQLPPLAPAPLKVILRNTSAEPRRVLWPDAAQLWLVDSAGVRVASGTAIDAPREALTLAPAAVIEREVPFDSSRLEGESFGEYRVFVDLDPDGDFPRVPSNPVPFRWELSAADVSALLTQAAGGQRTGARNAPLKLLRVHLGEIAPALTSIRLDALTAPAATLASQLKLAACLKPIQPTPGLVQIDVRIEHAGRWSIGAPMIRACLGGDAVPAPIEFESLLAVRRHLGWEIFTHLQPDPDATLAEIHRVAGGFLAMRAELRSEPRVMIPIGTNRVSTIDFPPTPTPANLVVRLRPGQTEVARRLPDPQMPTRNLIQAGELRSEPFTAVAPSAGLSSILNDGKLPAPKTLVLTAGELTWTQLLKRLDPLVQRGMAIDVVVVE